MTSRALSPRSTSHPDRPHIHFTPETGWMNDPCGLIRLGDTFHLFYQHNPDAVEWGNMHWGHASSTDLLEWRHHQLALTPDHVGQIFTGCVVLDRDDTAVFGLGSLIAVFTHEGPLGQVQSLAWSSDQAMTWTKFDRNPVLSAPSPTPDFRDPKVVRFGNGTDGVWVMALSVGHVIEFYRSSDLQDWVFASRFEPTGTSQAILEVPDLIDMPNPDGGRTWVLLYSIL